MVLGRRRYGSSLADVAGGGGGILGVRCGGISRMVGF